MDVIRHGIYLFMYRIYRDIDDGLFTRSIS